MVSYKRMLINQNNNPNTNDGQREANDYRLKLLELFEREKPEREPYHSTDVIMERLNDASYRFTPNKLLSAD